jgi:DNA-binding response OmpR family regulator
VDDLVIDTRSQQARRGDQPVALTAKEFALLELLGRRAGTVVSRAVIVSHVWDENHDPGTNAIEVYINRLRRKIDLPGHAPLIHTRRGAGYLLGPPPGTP